MEELKWYTEKRKIGDLQEYKNNPRKISDENKLSFIPIKRLKKFGFDKNIQKIIEKIEEQNIEGVVKKEKIE